MSLQAVNMTLRIEQTLIRLEGMMARVLLETQFGQNVLDQTIEIISSDPGHKTLEFQFLSAQTMRLIDSLRQLLTGGNLTIDISWNPPIPLKLVFVQSTSPLHVLHRVLGILLKINDTTILAMSVMDTMVDLGAALDDASEESLDWYIFLSESFAGLDNWILLLDTMTTHTENLFRVGQKVAALSIAQDTVDLSRPIIIQLIESSSTLSLTLEDEFNAVRSRAALFILVEVLSSLDRDLEACKASKEAFWAISLLPMSIHPPSGTDIDSFMEQICKIAEAGGFSVAMLADCVFLFRNLARMYPEETASQFLAVLYAYVYFSQQGNPPDTEPMQNLHMFLEPNSDQPPPEFDITRGIDLSVLDGIIEDAIRAYYACPSDTRYLVIRKIFVTHFDQAILILREVALLQILIKISKHFCAILTHWRAGEDSEWLLDVVIGPIFGNLWRAGLLDLALAECEQVIKYLLSHYNADDADVVARLWWLRTNQHFVLFDTGRVSDAIAMIQQTGMDVLSTIDEVAVGTDVNFLLPCIIQSHIHRRTRKHRQALQIIKRGVDDESRKLQIDFLDLYYHYLLVELAVTLGHLGQSKDALNIVERTVAACRKDVPDSNVEGQTFVLVHSLTPLSNCLATIRRNDEALATAQEAILRNLALILWRVDHRDKAIVACEEAVSIMRKVVDPETYFLPALAKALDQLAGYFTEKGDGQGASTTTTESAEVRKKFAALPPQPDFLFERVKMDVESDHPEADKDAEDDEYHNTLDTAADVEEMVLEAACAIISEMQNVSTSAQMLGTPSADTVFGSRNFTATPGGTAISRAAVIEPFSEAQVSVSLVDETEASSAAGPDKADTAFSAKSPFTDILSTPLEVNLSMNVHSTPVDILWWMLLLLLGILFAVLWSRVP
ncbi:hypothetical protein B0H19DRAFT_1056859 [Mycena capillaripes]|nr:hypothetical protein B0H19DRAFT_1056859 [Mycena capillaripes]